MPTVAFVAPFFLDTTLRFVQATAELPDVRLALMSQDPVERLPDRIRKRFGEEVAFECSKEAWDTGWLHEVRRGVEAMNISGNDIAAIFKYYQIDPGFGAMFDIKCELPSPDLGYVTVERCWVLDKLERLGLVSRTPSTSDRRATTLAASAEGRRVVRDYERIKKDCLQPILGEFELREIEQLTELLERFAVALYSRQRPSREACLWCGAYIDDDCAIARIRGGCPCRDSRSSSSTEAGMT